MGSPLDFINSDGFRKRLITRNLTPYAKAPNRPSTPTNTEYIQSDTSVQDSPDQLIDEPSLANRLYPLNQYGQEGGYKQAPDPTGLLNNKSNEGEYGYQDANLIAEALPESQRWKPLNTFSNGNQLPIDSANFFNSLDRPAGYSNRFNNQPYPQFNPSSYGPAQILLSPDPLGNNGLLSQDSFIAKLGAQRLRDMFQQQIASQIRQDTLGRANILNVNSGTDIVNILSGNVPIIEPNFTITVPQNPILAATNLALRLAGSISPVSTIPGSYFDPTINTNNPTTLQQVGNAFRKSAVGRFVSNLLSPPQTGSQIMFNNMGAGQKSRLFKNIDFNKYKPAYPKSFLQRLGGAIVGQPQVETSNYYIGSITSEPSRVFSPSGSLPNNARGQEQQSPVFGPSELAQLYEGPSKEIRLGANGPTYGNGGGIEGGLTWVSPKYKGNAGKKVGINGEITSDDQDFKPSSYNTTESTNILFKEGSILDQTQRIIDSQPQGGKRLQHVGNAIDQVSKVFNDGYKEMTKGSRVYRYVGPVGQEVGTEYCRVFAKDIPYLQYNDLQKTDGIVTEGRRFSYSVLDKTYNLNMYPNKQEGGQDSSNLINGPGGTSTNVAYAKKYMFSLENLAWRTSSTAGFSVNDLPICERGPNGGRVMWFPPYDLKFSESVSTSWKQSDFLGRPEPIYTYNNTTRGGSLSWKIVVDHPSVLNVIVDKVLGNETNKVRVDSIIESFFAGCRKYDLYELAKKYYTINPNDLYQLQQAITSKELTRNQLQTVKQTLQTGNDTPNGQTTPISSTPTVQSFDSFVNNAFYFGNDSPKKGNLNYQAEFSTYTSQANIALYQRKSPSTSAATTSFFDAVVKPNKTKIDELIKALIKAFNEAESGNITITFNASCSAPATITYNKELAERRVESAIQYISTNSELKKYVENNAKKQLLFIKEKVLGEEATVKQYDSSGKELSNRPVNCSDTGTGVKGGDTVGSTEIYTTNAMACRRAFIVSVKNNLLPPKTEQQPGNAQPQTGTNQVPQTIKVPISEDTLVPRDNITKRVLRALLSECDYFETIKETSPMVYDNLKDKLKFFQPAFHSMTPEGLNSRLTFLQQCMRPGQTIPTIKDLGDGFRTLDYNNATNTAFGAPPVLILRVGDFYNTKIIPESLNLSYETLDTNPEGIGIQPMIATIQMNFKFVGGSGLKNSIDKLQNALTFNYYANTEIYDDRADVTDSSYKVLDAEFLKSGLNTAPPSNNQSNLNGKSNDNTIGTITGIEVTETGETGTIQYTTFMNNSLPVAQTYYQNIVNKNKEIIRQYNNGVRQQWMTERNYSYGNLVPNNLDLPLFGKPNNVESRINKIFDDILADVNNGQDEFLNYLSSPNLNISTRILGNIKTNYINYINKVKTNFQNGLTKIIQDTTNQQQTFINLMGKMNVITFNGQSPTSTTGTDGFQLNNGPVKIYNTSGTTNVSTSNNGATDTLTELKNDIERIGDDLWLFNQKISEDTTFTYTGDKKAYTGVLVFDISPYDGKQSGADKLTPQNVFNPFSTNAKFSILNFRRQYFILAQTILDDKKYLEFRNAIVGNQVLSAGASASPIVSPDVVTSQLQFDVYWNRDTKPLFKQENDITTEFIDNMEKGKLKNFMKYTPFPEKTREFTFTTQTSAVPAQTNAQKLLIEQIGAQTNITTNTNTWSDKPDGGLALEFVTKAKLN